MLRAVLMLHVFLFAACKSRAPSSSLAEASKPKNSLSETICIDPQMLALSNSAMSKLAQYMGPTAASTGILGNKPLDGKTIEPKVAILNKCMAGFMGQDVNLKFSFANPYDIASCRCVISPGLAPAGFTPALSCGADSDEATAPGCLLVRIKGCQASSVRQILYAPIGKRLSCVNYAKALFPNIKIVEFRGEDTGDTDDLLTTVVNKAQLTTPTCQAAVITPQQWDVFATRRPGFAKNAEIFAKVETPGNIISCADPDDTKWLQSKAFSGEGIDHPCFATSRSGFGSCVNSPVLTKAVKGNSSGATSDTESVDPADILEQPYTPPQEENMGYPQEQYTP